MEKIFFIILIAILAGSCSKKLDRLPKNDVTAGQVYSTPQGYIEAAAKVYGAFALTGNKGPAGDPDVKGIDEGTSDFLRLFWCAQELSTDEAVVTWGDAGLQDFHNMNWSSSNPFLTGLYYRSMYQITLANDFIRHAGDAELASKGITGSEAANIVNFRNEARFLRAYQYWVLLDLFGNPPFVTEDFVIGSTTLPEQIGKEKLYAYIESELKDLENLLPEPIAENYGRATRAAAQALLARLYLNAATYTGTANYNDAVAYSKKVIGGSFGLIADYRNLMRADNDKNKKEFILTINYDGNYTQNYGGTTFLTHAPVGGSMKASDFGIGGGWAGLRTTKGLVSLFPDISGNTDKRAQFWANGQSLDISDMSKFDQGYGITKFKNIKIGSTNSPGSSFDYADVDFPIFRLAEQYLIYAEAVLRGGSGGDAATALGYINELRTRAGASTVSSAQLTTNFILDERGRELYWEGFRRTDLIRYKRFTTADYVWPWKGGSSAGKAVEDWRNIYPIPSVDKNANPNLQQNPNY